MVALDYPEVAAALRDTRLAHWQESREPVTAFDRSTRAWMREMHPGSEGMLRRQLRTAIDEGVKQRDALVEHATRVLGQVHDGDLIRDALEPFAWAAAARVLGLHEHEPPPTTALASALPELAQGGSGGGWGEWIVRASTTGVLATAYEGGGVAFGALLLYALTDNLQNATALAVHTLLRHRADAARLASGEVEVQRAVRELLRYDSPVQAVPLVALESVVIGKHEVTEGSRVLAAIGAAHRDPKTYPHPARLDLEREGLPPLAFGHGPLRCMGARFATVALEAVVSAAAPRCVSWTLREADIRWRTVPPMLRGPHTLPVHT